MGKILLLNIKLTYLVDLALMFSFSLYLLPYFVYTSSEGSGKTAHMCAVLPEPSLFANGIGTKISCADSTLYRSNFVFR